MNLPVSDIWFSAVTPVNSKSNDSFALSDLLYGLNSMAHKSSRPQVRIQTGPFEIFGVSDSTNIEADTDEPISNERSNEVGNGKAESDNEKNVSVSSPDHAEEKQPARIKLPKSLEWIPANSTWSKWKPVIRSAIAAWITVVIFVISRTENLLGQVCYLPFCSSWFDDHIFEGRFPYHNR
jgi:hypothetical protein